MRVMRIYLRMKTQSMKVNASEKPEQDGNPSAAGSGECHSICPGLQQDYYHFQKIPNNSVFLLLKAHYRCPGVHQFISNSSDCMSIGLCFPTPSPPPVFCLHTDQLFLIHVNSPGRQLQGCKYSRWLRQLSRCRSPQSSSFQAESDYDKVQE